MTAGDTDSTTRQRRQLAEIAIAHATRGEWEAAVETNREIIEAGPDVDAYNRLGKALAELGRAAEALEAYQSSLARDRTNHIAQRNVERLRVLLEAQASGDGRSTKAPAAHFIEEMGKTGSARLINLAPARQLAPLSPGDAVELRASETEIKARGGGREIGQVEPRIANRLLKLMAGGNRYEAAIITLSEAEVRLIIREVYAHPTNFGIVSFPGSAGIHGSDVRPYIKGTPVRYDDEEAPEESEEEPEEVEELDTSLPELSGEPELEEELLEEP